MSMAGVQERLFFGCVPHHIPSDTLQEEFKKHGSVKNFYFMPDSQYGDRGWGFVSYATVDEAQVAMMAMHGKEVFAGAVRPFMLKVSGEKITKLEGTVFENNTKPVTPWTEFTTDEGDPYFYNAITQETVWERPADMDRAPMHPNQAAIVAAENQPRPGGQGPPGANLFVLSIPNAWDDNQLMEFFKPHGEVITAKVQIDPTTQASKGFGFVNFASREGAADAIKATHGQQVDGRTLKVRVKRGEEEHALYLPEDQAAEVGRAQTQLALGNGPGVAGTAVGTMPTTL